MSWRPTTVYGNLAGTRPELDAWRVMNAVMARVEPNVKSLADLERRRHDDGAFGRLEPELPRLHGILMERMPDVYDHVGLDFLPRLAKAFPKQEHPTGCPKEGLNGGICQSQELPEAEILRRLDAITPGFSEWSARSYDAARR